MRDQYIGIDLHKAFFQACAVAPTGDRLWEGRFPRTAAGLEALPARCTPRSALAVEARTPTWHFADGLVGAVGEVRIVDPLLLRGHTLDARDGSEEVGLALSATDASEIPSSQSKAECTSLRATGASRTSLRRPGRLPP